MLYKAVSKGATELLCSITSQIKSYHNRLCWNDVNADFGYYCPVLPEYFFTVLFAFESMINAFSSGRRSLRFSSFTFSEFSQKGEQNISERK